MRVKARLSLPPERVDPFPIATQTLCAKPGRSSVRVTDHFLNSGVSVGGGCAQILSAIFRPNKLSAVRVYWNVIHHSLGYTTLILGVINIFRGFDLLFVRTRTLESVHILDSYMRFSMQLYTNSARSHPLPSLESINPKSIFYQVLSPQASGSGRSASCTGSQSLSPQVLSTIQDCHLSW